DLSVGDGDAESLQLGRPGKSGVYVGQGSKRADHQAGANQKNERQGHLHDNKHAPRTVLISALADAPSSLANACGEMYAGVFKDGNTANQQAGEERRKQSEKQNGSVNADFVDARQT